MKEAELIYPSPSPPTRSVALATEYLAKVVEEDCGTKNGQTALYWHLIAVIQKHAGKKESANER